jgi:hypothetical protein
VFPIVGPDSARSLTSPHDSQTIGDVEARRL